MFEAGFAWRYVQFDKAEELSAAEADARDRRSWADPNPTPPGEWRRMKRQASKAAP
ncbi:MAG TPA: hypothetical protein VG055_17340 [Planctomycetaceae bacterium]|nr:hypothetical protein [Planctomycetaceae bacterium]